METDSLLPAPLSLRTERLILRPWRESDLPAFVRMGRNAQVMRHFPSLLSEEESLAIASRIRVSHQERGYGFWAAEIPKQCEFIGFVGLSHPSFESHFTPCVEIGWRLDEAHWNQGYATEAARKVLDVGFTHLGMQEIVSFTAVDNVASRRVMEKLGMTCSRAEDFDHPRVPEGPLRRHVLYRIGREGVLGK